MNRRMCLFIFVLLSLPITTLAGQTLSALRSGSISNIHTFGVLPHDGDRLDAGRFTVIIDRDLSAGQITARSGSVALTGEFIVASGVKLTVNGDWDASQKTTQNQLQAGAHVEFDGPAGVKRNYIAASAHYQPPSLVINASAQDKAFFGLKPGSAATFDYNKQGFLGANINGGHVHLNGFHNGYIHDGYDTLATRHCKMPHVLITNSGTIELRYVAAANGSCYMPGLTILSPKKGTQTAFRTAGDTNSTIRGSAFSLNGLSVDGRVEYYTRAEFNMNDWVLRELAATLPKTGWKDPDSWLLFNADTLPVGGASTSNIYFRNKKHNPHGFVFSTAPIHVAQRTIDSIVFDFINLDPAESGDMYVFNGPGNPKEIISISNNIGLKNHNGKQSSTFVTFNGSHQNGRRVKLENNVMYIPSTNRVIALNEASQTPAHSLISVKNNIFWGDAKSPGYVIDSLGTTSETNILAPGAYSNNAVYNARSDGQFNELDLPLSYTPEPLVIHAAPSFYDDQRRLGSYGSQVLNLDGSAEAAFTAHLIRHLSANDIKRLSLMAGHQSYVDNHRGRLVIKDLIDWVKQGFIATSVPYQRHSSTKGPLGLSIMATR